MARTTAQLPTLPRERGTLPSVRQLTGEVVYMYAFDVAYEMIRQPVRELLGQPGPTRTWAAGHHPLLSLKQHPVPWTTP